MDHGPIDRAAVLSTRIDSLLNSGAEKRSRTTSANYACGGVIGHASDCNRKICFNVAGSAKERRDQFMRSIRDLAEHEEWQAAYDAVIMLGPSVGRSEKWLAACAWFHERKEEGKALSWIVIQGSVFLAYANV